MLTTIIIYYFNFLIVITFIEFSMKLSFELKYFFAFTFIILQY